MATTPEKVFTMLTDRMMKPGEQKNRFLELTESVRKTPTAIPGTFTTPHTTTTTTTGTETNWTATALLYRDATSSSRKVKTPPAPSSIGALEFIGLTQPTAETLYTNFSTCPNPAGDPRNLIEFVIDHVSDSMEESVLTLEKRTTVDVLQRAGLDTVAFASLLGPNLGAESFSEEIFCWVKHSLRVRYGSLLFLHQRAMMVAAGEVMEGFESIDVSMK